MRPMAATATTATREPEASDGVRAAEFRAALDEALKAAAADERIGPLIGATKLRMQFVFADCDLALKVAGGEEEPHLVWSFGDELGWTPKLVLEMEAAVANRYLQGRESLAIAIARGQVRVRGESRTALLYLPAARLICEPYRRVVEDRYPALRV
jgi:hypothetical protein